MAKMKKISASARHILVSTEQECQELKERINSGEKFEDIAKAHSLCPSKADGGDLGEFSPGMMVKEFDDVVFVKDLGVVHGPIKTQFGFHLVEITSRSF